MVNLVEDWEVLEGYAGDKQGYYQVLSNALKQQLLKELREDST